MNALDYLKLSAVNNMFSSQEERDAEKIGKLAEVDIVQLVDFKEHPFPVVEDDEMNELRKSISENGVLEPAIAFWNEDGNLELATGHRRKYCCSTLGFKTMPVLIKKINRDQATIIMGESNFKRRKDTLPSVKARAYKMMLDAFNHQGKRNDLTMAAEENEDKMSSREKLAQVANESIDNIKRYLQLNKLIPQLLNLVDKKRIGLRPACKMAQLPTEIQAVIYNYYMDNEVTPSYAQAKEMVDLYKENQNGNYENGILNAEKVNSILEEKKGNQKEDTISITKSFCRKYFPNCDTQIEIEQAIIKLFNELNQFRDQGNSAEHGMN